MLNKYSISTSGPQKTTIALKQADLIILTRPTDEEIQQLCQTFNLNKFSFRYRSSPEEVSRFHRTTSDVLDNPFFLVFLLSNILKNNLYHHSLFLILITLLFALIVKIAVKILLIATTLI